jgi:TRAP-type C4-dicarboxylate transport system substrate-binding protein
MYNLDIKRRNVVKKSGFLFFCIVFALLVVSLMGCSKKEGTATPGASAAQSGAANQPIPYIVAYTWNPGVPEDVACREAMKRLEERTNGGIKVTIHGASTLGADLDIIEGMLTGTIDQYCGSNAPVYSYAKPYSLFDIGFVATDLQKLRNAVLYNPETYKRINDKVAKSSGLRLVGLQCGDFRNLMASKVIIKDLAGLRNFKIRTMSNPNHIALWKSLGANPTPISGSEIFTALQNGTVDGWETSVVQFYTGRYAEFVRNIHRSYHIANIQTWVVRDAWYQALPDDYRTIYDDVMLQCMKDVDAIHDKLTAEYLDELKKDGLTYTEWSPDVIAAARKAYATSGVEESVRKDAGDDLVDWYLNALK